MRIQASEVKVSDPRFPIKNRTWKYLAPCLRKYGDHFEKRIASVFKVGLGLDDVSVTNKSMNPVIFILIDSRQKPTNFISFLKWLKEHEAYVTDYVYGESKLSALHMVVIGLPAEYTETYAKFLQGKYSEMYTPEDIETLFTKKPEMRGIFRKDKPSLKAFVKELNKKFGVTETIDSWKGEVDFPPDMTEEIFD